MSDPQLPSVDEIKRAIDKQSKAAVIESQGAFEGKFQREAVESQAEYAHLTGILDHYEHKKRWSNFLMLLMIGMIGFQSWLIVMVGTKQWDFADYPWLVPALLVQNFGQIIGLAVFVVKSLFK